MDLRNKNGTYNYSLDESGKVMKLEQKVIGSNFSETKSID